MLEKRGKFLVGDPFFEPGQQISIGKPPAKARAGKLALIAAPGGGARNARAKILRLLGSPNIARNVVEALMLDRGLRRRFPKKVLAAAEAARLHPHPEPQRRDLRDLVTFTIDPTTAKDFDDAISAERLSPTRTRIWVHIADVSAFVRPGDPVDNEARRRATSVYVPGAVEPMLPEALSNDACSLVPGEDRLAVTAELEFEDGALAASSFYRSLIRSDKRLSYEDVDQIFAGEAEAEDPWREPLAAAREVSAALEAARRAGGAALAIESVEPEFAFDLQGHVADSVASVQTESHRLIEHLMIAANSAVATLCCERAIPTLYRIHERPESESVQRLLDQLASLDVATPPAAEHISSADAGEVVAAASLAVDEHVKRTGVARMGLTYLVLRSLRQARYSPDNLGHAGLGLSNYCHFTSPIRRYPDLLCHRALLSAVGFDEKPPRADELDEAAVWTSERERDAIRTERIADSIAGSFLLERRLMERGPDEPFEGEVTGLINAGIFISFDGGAHEGFLPVRRIKGDWWDLNEQGTIMTGSRTGTTIRFGDRLKVKVDRIDTARGRVDLVLAEEPDAR
ncbi:MAG: RNB domain-containing ribonuclease [Actinobacteria bacterium]|nr:RNB domain-containing ribonuclease [Actinomycetota bacterium]